MLAERGRKWVHKSIGESGPEVTTIHTTGSAQGDAYTTINYGMYKGSHLYTSSDQRQSRRSYLNLKLLQQVKAWNIHLVCLPAHTSHILQPMDLRDNDCNMANDIEEVQNMYSCSKCHKGSISIPAKPLLGRVSVF